MVEFAPATESKSEIQEFYAGKSVFITGVSGFLGKAVLEKLLRSCPNVSNVYVLLRRKFGVGVDSRLKSIIESPIFATLKQENPGALEKVIAIAGSITFSNLGLRQEDRDVVVTNVSVVIHCAGSVKLNEPLKDALNINYNGTRRILDLCHEIKHLSALVYVSTAYANCDISEIDEEIQTPNPQIFSPKEIESLTNEEAEEIMPMVLRNKPNTYCYTKCMAESLLKQEGGQLPICIVRPSIIGAAWKEPKPGFVDSFNGVTGLIASAGKGVLTSMVCDADKITDIIPLDVTVNLILASAWNTAARRNVEIPVYNCCSGTINPISHGGVMSHVFETLEDLPFEGVIRYPSLEFVETHSYNTFLNIWFNFLPFLILDGIAVIMTRRPAMLKILKKVLTSVGAMTYFHTNEWRFSTDNMIKLESHMGQLDRELFYWNIKDLDWKNFFRNYCLGIKMWIYKEEVSDLPKAVRRRKTMYCVQKLIQLFLLVVVASIFVKLL